MNYKFTHRSFQEYFSAVFLKELSDHEMQKMGISLIQKDSYRATHDSVFAMLKDMADQRFEQNILLPLLCDIESVCEAEDKYDFYFEKCAPMLSFKTVPDDSDDLRLVLYGFSDEVLDYLFETTRHYIPTSPERNTRIEAAEKQLLELLTEHRGYIPETQFAGLDYRLDEPVYSLIKNTWVGNAILTLSNLSTELQRKKQDTMLDLSGLLSE